MTDSSALGSIVDTSSAIFIDFDGPICDLFHNLRNPFGADRLRHLLDSHQIPINERLRYAEDAFEILHATPQIAPWLTTSVETELAKVERHAASTAVPTAHGHEVISACKRSGRNVVIVSNTSSSAIRLYLSRFNLSPNIDSVVGRDESDPQLLKPNPFLLNRALTSLSATPCHATMIGDQISDVLAARAAGIRSIGYANKPGKRERLTQAGSDAIITSMSQLIPVLESPLRSREQRNNPSLEIDR